MLLIDATPPVSDLPILGPDLGATCAHCGRADGVVYMISCYSGVRNPAPHEHCIKPWLAAQEKPS
jgi:hypothetical protein